MVSHEDRRRERLQTMKESWGKAKNPDREKLFRYCSLEWGLSRRTFNEYCKILEI